MDNGEIIKELHVALGELVGILRDDGEGIKRFPRFLYIYQQVSLAIEDPEALEDKPFLEDIKGMILGMYSGGSGSYNDYGIWKENKIERREINEKFNKLNSELSQLARSLQTRKIE
jgi:hypothetical protein